VATWYAGLAGYVEYNVVELTSGVVPLSTDMSAVAGCISASGKVNSGFSVRHALRYTTLLGAT